jgi:hypothetical protein
VASSSGNQGASLSSEERCPRGMPGWRGQVAGSAWRLRQRWSLGRWEQIEPPMPTIDLRAPLNLRTTSPCQSTLPRPAASPAPLLTSAAATPAQNWPRSGPSSRRQHLSPLCQVALFRSLCRSPPPRPAPSTPPPLRLKNQPSEGAFSPSFSGGRAPRRRRRRSGQHGSGDWGDFARKARKGQ